MKPFQERWIATAYREMPDIYTGGFVNEKDRLLAACIESEKAHRKVAPAGTRWGMSVNAAARYFAIKWMARGALQLERYSVADFLSIRPDAFRAAAMAAYVLGKGNAVERDALLAWANSGDVAQVLALDYAEMVNQ